MLVPAIGRSFDPATHERSSTRVAFGRAVLDLCAGNPDAVFLTADGTLPTATKDVFERFPDRTFNVGIAEQNLIAMAAGMASCGLVPVVGGYGPFLAFRGLEQIRNDAAYTKLNVTIGGVYTSLTLGTGGSTHHTTEDISMLRSIANLTLLSPADAKEAYKATLAAAEYPTAVYIRLGGRVDEPVLYGDDYKFEIGKAITLRDGSDATIVATGTMVIHAVIASDILKDEGLGVRVLNIHTIKPLDEEILVKAAEETGKIVTAEEHTVLGGLGGAVAEVLGDRCPVPVKRIGIDDVFASIGPWEELQDKYGLNAEGIASTVRGLVSA